MEDEQVSLPFISIRSIFCRENEVVEFERMRMFVNYD